jgi:hypothetical protein
MKVPQSRTPFHLSVRGPAVPAMTCPTWGTTHENWRVPEDLVTADIDRLVGSQRAHWPRIPNLARNGPKTGAIRPTSARSEHFRFWRPSGHQGGPKSRSAAPPAVSEGAILQAGHAKDAGIAKQPANKALTPALRPPVAGARQPPTLGREKRDLRARSGLRLLHSHLGSVRASARGVRSLIA